MLDIEILRQLSRLLANDLSMSDFQTWFTRETWDIHKRNEPRAEDLTYTLQLLFAEFSSGHLPYNELLLELTPLLRNITVEFPGGMTKGKIETGANSAPLSLHQFSDGSLSVVLA